MIDFIFRNPFLADHFRKCFKSQSPFADNGYRNCICILLRHQNIDFRRIQRENCVYAEKIGDFFKTTVFGEFFGRPIWEMIILCSPRRSLSCLLMTVLETMTSAVQPTVKMSLRSFVQL